MSMEHEDETQGRDTQPAQSPAWPAYLMARYNIVVLPVAADCAELLQGLESLSDPEPFQGEAYAAVDAIMRYYNG